MRLGFFHSLTNSPTGRKAPHCSGGEAYVTCPEEQVGSLISIPRDRNIWVPRIMVWGHQSPPTHRCEALLFYNSSQVISIYELFTGSVLRNFGVSQLSFVV
jgi:hypothetical protein